MTNFYYQVREFYTINKQIPNEKNTVPVFTNFDNEFILTCKAFAEQYYITLLPELNKSIRYKDYYLSDIILVIKLRDFNQSYIISEDNLSEDLPQIESDLLNKALNIKMVIPKWSDRVTFLKNEYGIKV